MQHDSSIGRFFVFIGLFFVLLPEFVSASASIVVSEIAAYEQSGCEWVEIVNIGSSAVSMEGWKFVEGGVNHGLKISSSSAQGDWVIEPGEYAIVTQQDTTLLSGSGCRGRYTAPQGTLFDSSWSTLNEGGEMIGFKDAGGAMAEQFTYIPAKIFSLERKNLSTQEYTNANWQEHPDGNTFGKPNYWAANDPVLLSPPPPTATPPSSPDASAPSPAPAVSAGRVYINEFLPHPSEGDEWVELYNPETFSVSLTGWLIADDKGVAARLSGSVDPKGFFVYVFSSPVLNNDRDSLTLTDTGGGVSDRVSYGAKPSAPARGHALARVFDGYDMAEDWQDFLETMEPTMGTANRIVSPQKSPAPPPARELAMSDSRMGVDTPTSPPKADEVGGRIRGSDQNSVPDLIAIPFVQAAEASVSSSAVIVPKDGGQQAQEPVPVKTGLPAVEAGAAMTPLHKVSLLKAGRSVSVRGIVAVVPGVFGSQIFYLINLPSVSSAAVQVYQHQKAFPLLNIGDEVEVRGVLSRVRGETRIKVAKESDIAVRRSVGHPEAIFLAISSASTTAPRGGLVRIEGEVVEKKGDIWYVGDGGGELRVVWKKGAIGGAQNIGVGERVSVAGILRWGDSGAELLPRGESDVRQSANASPPRRTTSSSYGWVFASTSQVRTYLAASAAGLAALLAALIFRIYTQRGIVGKNKEDSVDNSVVH